MVRAIACICGYHGPSVAHDGRAVCPVCRTPGTSPEEDRLVRCPRGHVLRVPATLLGQGVVCPRCNGFFLTSASCDVERRREVDRPRQAREARRARAWLVRAVWAAVLVVALVGGLVMAGAMR